MRKHWIFASLAVALAACGDSSSPNAYQEFIAEGSSNNAVNLGTEVQIDVTARITDLQGRLVQGATVYFAPSRGTVMPTTKISNSAGDASTTWHIPLPWVGTEELNACASNSRTRCETYYNVLTVTSSP